MSQLENIHINEITPIISPENLKQSVGISTDGSDFVINARQTIARIISKQDPRHLVIVGPCSIHDPFAAIEYAKKLAPLVKKYQEKLQIIMRVYFEKPRTNIGWKGLINDPDLNETNHIEKGLKQAREILKTIIELGVPTGSELLDPILPQYYADLICWASIGARTSESQTHREMASGLSMPIGFKNATDGNIDVALHAIQAAQHPHAFIGVTQAGVIARVESNGNPNAHLILRGGSNGPNYSSVQMEEHLEKIEASGISTQILVDCSHGNSRKKAENQHKVVNSILNQIASGNSAIVGLMIESFLVHGNQSISNTPRVYGQSITDECIGWEETDALLADIYNRLP
ncbi:MAG: 3-deoxy-7-phosphoheptulonate synthase [Candidatus Margulisbacteria bacterium]|jgi:3-deoxy-7-phosphoheptulonate synthase|nr:3-deoxy-7-phosphoheptulonate synthase [Candidatus Margulisiibacteriota bacterium]